MVLCNVLVNADDDGISPSELAVVLKSTLSAATRSVHTIFDHIIFINKVSFKLGKFKIISVLGVSSRKVKIGKLYLRWFETVFHFPLQLNFMEGLLVCSKRLLLLVNSRCCNNL